MKTQISFKKTNGSDGVALLDGDASSILQAKRELANKLYLPDVESSAGESAAQDARLRGAGIDPDSLKIHHVSE
ncbi:hypothetical protein [Achromobacter deleyi]|uniref:hypothetical protein n=1 Tax=Achromobacter deleyi TaxID=1353891 RepID=UPI001491565F|nr:hypothetical protein [Achromobacter deleyi]QVQ29155.1 hypothetical protein HLG70_12450 [Achromobacter deleyi]UIP19274.1 hypothetical protein LYZ39_20050 [Achromobacter deleyi]